MACASAHRKLLARAVVIVSARQSQRAWTPSIISRSPARRSSEATVTIRGGKLAVERGHLGKCDLQVTADSETWLGFLAKERSLLWAMLRRKIRISGSPKLLIAFGKCFPS